MNASCAHTLKIVDSYSNYIKESRHEMPAMRRHALAVAEALSLELLYQEVIVCPNHGSAEVLGFVTMANGLLKELGVPDDIDAQEYINRFGKFDVDVERKGGWSARNKSLINKMGLGKVPKEPRMSGGDYDIASDDGDSSSDSSDSSDSDSEAGDAVQQDVPPTVAPEKPTDAVQLAMPPAGVPLAEQRHTDVHPQAAVQDVTETSANESAEQRPDVVPADEPDALAEKTTASEKLLNEDDAGSLAVEPSDSPTSPDIPADSPTSPDGLAGMPDNPPCAEILAACLGNRTTSAQQRWLDAFSPMPGSAYRCYTPMDDPSILAGWRTPTLADAEPAIDLKSAIAQWQADNINNVSTAEKKQLLTLLQTAIFNLLYNIFTSSFSSHAAP